MKRLVLIAAIVTCSLAAAQDRGAALEKAAAEARAAYLELQAAEQRRDAGIAPLPGERIGTAVGATRASDEYLARQAGLENEVRLARERYQAAQKRWNDLK
jgi:hypothetical protein